MKTQAAFPNIGLVEGITVPWKISDETRSDGMSLRDYFAAKAMQGCIAKGAPLVFQDIASKAYEMADAMLEARKDSNVHNPP